MCNLTLYPYNKYILKMLINNYTNTLAKLAKCNFYARLRIFFFKLLFISLPSISNAESIGQTISNLRNKTSEVTNNAHNAINNFFESSIWPMIGYSSIVILGFISLIILIFLIYMIVNRN